MAQKATKLLARRNTQVLNRTHMISIGVHLFFLIFRMLLFRASFTRGSFLRYGILSAPAVAIEVVFERGSRPQYHGDDATAELRRSGEDLDAKGLTEWMWDILYWTWGCIVTAAILGDWAWWFYLAVPIYSAWLAYSTYSGVRSGSFFGGAGGGDGALGTSSAAAGTSKRQQKMEARGQGGQRVKYR